MVVVHFKDGTSQTFDAATALAPYPSDSLFTLVYAPGASIAAVPTDNIQYADVQSIKGATMPHVSNFLLDGKKIPSVNEVSVALSLEGLIRNFYRVQGFKKADKISNAAREQGTKLATIMEKYRQTGKTGKIPVYHKTCVDNWTEWFNDSKFQILDDCWVEPHLVNTVDGYHGSPDVIMHTESSAPGISMPVLGDDKSKKRFADYKLIMNEHAYAMCDSYEDQITKEIKKLPWDPPIKTFWFWTYHPQTGRLYPVEHEFDPAVYQDFLKCKEMGIINKRAEVYFGKYAVLLPEE